MIWAILAVLFLILALGLVAQTEGSSIFILLPSALCMIPVIAGLCLYSTLAGRQAEVLALQSEIETIRTAHYSGVKSGEFVGGSLDNLKQSEVLSNYIKSYAIKKATYNAALRSAKIRKQLGIYYWWADGAFIHEEVMAMEAL